MGYHQEVWPLFVAMCVGGQGQWGLVDEILDERRLCWQSLTVAFVGGWLARRVCVTCMQGRFGWLC